MKKNPVPGKPAEQLHDLVSVGPATLKDFKLLGIRTLEQLAQQDAQELYERLCFITHQKHDICCLDVFVAAIEQARNPYLPEEQKQWYYWSRKRKHGA